MKTIKSMPWLKFLTYSAAGLFLFLYSCKDNAIDFNADDSKNVENEATTDAYFQDSEDMSGVAVGAASETLTGRLDGRTEDFPKSVDLRFSCATVTVVKSTSPVSTAVTPRGTITIDFGAGCTDAKGNVRKGKIIITYVGRRFIQGSTVTTTLENYYINGIKLEGTRTVTNSSSSNEDAPRFNVVLAGGKATWPDGTFATREANRTIEWTRTANPLQDQLAVSGSAAGSNRNGRTYTMSITKALVYKRECAVSNRVYMAVQGTKELTADGKKITIDYGAGDCDRMVTITINGKSKEVEVKGDI